MADSTLASHRGVLVYGTCLGMLCVLDEYSTPSGLPR